MMKSPLGRLIRDLCPAYAAAWDAIDAGIPPEERAIPDAERIEAFRVAEGLKDLDEVVAELLKPVPDTPLFEPMVEAATILVNELEPKLATGEVDRWLREHPHEPVTRAEVEEHLAFERYHYRVPPPARH
jgi:hypothetical protein